MPYIKAHPFGYKPVKDFKSNHFRDPLVSIQSVVIKGKYTVHYRDEKGIIIGAETYENTFIRPVKNYNPRPKRGRTLGDMVYEFLKA